VGRFQFSDYDFRFDSTERTLSNDEQRRVLQPVQGRLLDYLIRNADRIAPTDEIIRAVWENVAVTSSSLHQALRGLRNHLSAMGAGESVIQTHRSRGYQLSTPIAEVVPESAAPLSLFVGRSKEIGQALANLELARTGKGRLVAVRGAAGIGKSRFVEEVVERASGRGFRSVLVRCADECGASPLWPWEQALRVLAESSQSEESTVPLYPGVGLERLLDIEEESLHEPASDDVRLRRLNLFDSVWQQIERQSRAQPILVAIDDIHLAEHVSLELLSAGLSSFPYASVVIIVSYRVATEPSDRSFESRIARVTQGVSSHVVDLNPLSRSDVETFAKRAAPDISARRLSELLPRTGGNPLLLQIELASMQALSDARGTGDARLSTAQAILEIVASLPSETGRWLRAATLLGQEVQLDLLSDMYGVRSTEIRRALEPALFAGLLVERPDGTVGFGHEVILEAIGSGLDPDARVRIHELTVRSLEKLAGHSASRIAEHAFEARSRLPAQEVVAYCERAGDYAAAQLAFEEAAQRYEQALLCLDANAKVDRVRLLLALSDAWSRIGKSRRLDDVFDEIIELSRDTGDVAALAQAVLSRATSRGVQNGRPGLGMVQLVEDTLEIYPDETPERVRLLSLSAELKWFDPPLAQARELSRNAVEMAERIGAHNALTESLIRAYRLNTTGPGDQEIRRETSRQLGDSLERARDLLLSAEAFVFLMGESAKQGDGRAFRVWAAKSRHAVEGHEGTHAYWWSLVASSSIAHLEGRFAQFDEKAEEALALGERLGVQLADTNHLIGTLGTKLDQGRAAELEPAFSSAAQRYPDNQGWLVAWRLCETHGGKTGAARALLRSVIEDQVEIPSFIAHTDILAMLALIAIRLRDTELASGIYRRLLPVADDHGFFIAGFTYTGSHHGHLGRLARIIGNLEGAKHHLETSIAAGRGMGALAAVARDQLALADVLERRGEAEDRSRIELLQSEAGVLQRDLGIEAVGSGY